MSPSAVHLGPLARIRPTVNFANHAVAPPGHEWGPRIIPDCQLVYVISGQAELVLGTRQYAVNAGDGVFYGADSPHRLAASAGGPLTFASIHFSWSKVSPEPVNPVPLIRNCSAGDLRVPAKSYAVAVDGYGDVTFPHHFAQPGLDSLFLPIAREYMNREPGYATVLRGLLTHLLTVIVRHQIHGGQAPAERKKIAPALDAIRKQPGAPWTTPELAALCGYHPTYFAKLFREVAGSAPKHYLVLERMRKAKELLAEADTVEEVAEALGYSSIHYFSRHFKAMTGLTPTAFRKQSAEL